MYKRQDPNEPTSRETSGNYNIEIGKYVLPRTMITYTQGINNKQNKYGIEYSLRRSVKFNAWHTSQGSTYIGAVSYTHLDVYKRQVYV